MEYKLSTCRVYLINQFTEGYRFIHETQLPQNWIEFIYVFENVHMMFPALKIRFTDMIGLTDVRPLAGVCMFIGLDEKFTRFYDFAVVRCDGKKIEDVRRMVVGSLTLYGIDMVGLWLRMKKSRSYGFKSASEVVERVMDELVEEYRKVCKFVQYDKRVVSSLDRFRYFQAGTSYASFLSYLRDAAKSGVERDGYLFWIERYSEGGVKKLGVRFVTVEELRKQEVKWRLEYTLSKEDFERAFVNDGVIEGNRVPILWLSVDGGGRQDVLVDRIADVVAFQIEGLKLCKKKLELKVGKGKRYWFGLDEFYRRVKDEVKNYLVSGSVRDRLSSELGVSPFVRAKMNRKIYVVVPGCSRIKLGDKVDVKVSAGVSSAIEMYRFVTGEWLVMGITHFISGQGRHYLQKLTLVSEDYKTESVRV